jgi:replicative DNA helicase
MTEVDLSQHIQDCFIQLIITDTKFITIARPLIKPEYFSSSITEKIVRLCYAFYDQFKEAPKNHLHDEVQRFIERKPVEEKKLFASYLTTISTLSVTNKDYVLSRIGNFVKSREFESAAVEFVELVEKGEFDEAKTLMYKTLKTDVTNEDVGLKYIDSTTPSYYTNLDESEYLIPTGIEHLTRLIGGYKRGQFVVFLGGQKGKKSWALCHTAKQALMKGLKVLHISHEMTLPEVEMRYDMMLGGLISDRHKRPVKFIVRDEHGEIIDDRTSSPEILTVYNIKRVLSARNSIRRFGGNLIIKKYPPRSCTMEEMERFLDHLETFEKFIPDVVIVDYIDIMKLPLGASSALRDRLNEIYLEHKRMADERNILLLSVSQSTRQGRRKVKMTHKDISEDIRKLANVDLFISFSQDDDQAEEQIMQVWVLGNRTGRDECGCHFQMNLDVGRFCTQSWFPPVTEAHNTEHETEDTSG